MAKRIRRFTMTVGGVAVTGARDFQYEDQSEYNRDRADNEAVGDEVRMSEGPFSVSFETLASASGVSSGYKDAMVVTFKEVERTAGSETVVDKTLTFAQGHLKVGVNVPTENPGRIPVTGEFKTMVVS